MATKPKKKVEPKPEPKEPTKPTPEEIKTEIKILEDYRTRVRPTSVFGDDHREAIAAQIEVLQGLKSRDDYVSEEDEVDEDADEDVETVRQNIIDAVDTAEQWMEEGSEDGPPSKEWESLLEK